ncbi:MAG: hypothetical protein Kow0042_23960 [Calditrichia bacterium]
MNYLIIFLISIATSTASALVGLGGGLMLIPFILLIFALPVKVVAGTMLFAMVPYTVVATIRNLKAGYVHMRIGLIMEIGSILGVILGANLTTILPNFLLKIFFVGIVLYLMFTLRIPRDSPYNYVARVFLVLNRFPPFVMANPSDNSRLSASALITVGLVAGVFSGMLGIGGGFLKTPVLIVGVGLNPKIAVGTALFMIFLTSLFGTITHGILDHINYPIALAITAGMMIGAYLGTSILKAQPSQRIKKFIFYAMLLAGILTFFR